MGLILLFSIIACLAMAMCNTTQVFADDCKEYYEEDSNDIDYGIWDEYNYDHCTIEKIYEEEKSTNTQDSYGVMNNQHNIVHVYNLRNDDGTHSNFDFEYDYRGYDGERSCLEGKENFNIQYFYNSETNEMALIRIGKYHFMLCTTSHFNGTYNHTSSHKTPFERKQEFKSSSIRNIQIGYNVKHIYIDPEIDFIGRYSLCHLHALESIDIINHCYNSSTMGDPGTRYKSDGAKVKCLVSSCFRNGGDWHKGTPIEVPFLHLFSQRHRNNILDNPEDKGFDETPGIVFNEGIYENHFKVFNNDGIESVTDMDGNKIPAKIKSPATTKEYKIKFKVKDNYKPPVVTDCGRSVSAEYNAEKNGYICALDIAHYNHHNIKVTAEAYDYKALTGMVMRDGERVYDVKVDLMDTNGNVIRSSYPGMFGYCFWVKKGFSGKLYVRDNTSSAWAIVNNVQDNVSNNLELGKGFLLSGTISKLVGEDKQQTIVKAAGVHLDLIDDNNQVIGKAVTDSERHYSVNVKAGASFKVHVYCSDPKVSGKIIMYDDKVYDVLFREW